MLIHSVYKNLLLINEESNLSSSDINNLLSNTWLTPLIELYQYDCLISFKTRSYTRMRFIRYLNELCENLKNTDKILKNDFLKHMSNYKILKLLDYCFIINNNIKDLQKIFYKLNRDVPNLVVDCILLYLINKNSNRFEYLDKYINNKNNILKYDYNVFPLINNCLDMGHNMLICYDLRLKKYVIFLLGGSDGNSSEYNYMKLNNYLSLDTKNRKIILKNKLYSDDDINKIMSKNHSVYKFLNYVY